MGKKYIIELEDKPFHNGNGDFLYRVKGFNSLVFDMTGVGKLTPYTEPDLGTLAKENFERGYRQRKAEEEKEIQGAYQRGLNDAWDAARTLWNTPNRKEIFGHTTFNTVLTTLTAQEAIEKIRQYEQEKEEIHLGDEVTFLPNNAKGIVSECHVPDVYSDNDKYAVWCGGTMEYVLKQHLTKTGRTFPEIAAVLKKMREE